MTIPLQSVAKSLKTHRNTLVRTVWESNKDPRSPLKEGHHYRLTNKGRVKILDIEGFISAYRLYLAHRENLIGTSLTEFCRMQRLNAQTVKALIEQKQDELQAKQIVIRHYRGWRILNPNIFCEAIFNDLLQPVDSGSDNDPQHSDLDRDHLTN
jgi:hypothetical protein